LLGIFRDRAEIRDTLPDSEGEREVRREEGGVMGTGGVPGGVLEICWLRPAPAAFRLNGASTPKSVFTDGSPSLGSVDPLSGMERGGCVEEGALCSLCESAAALPFCGFAGLTPERGEGCSWCERGVFGPESVRVLLLAGAMPSPPINLDSFFPCWRRKPGLPSE